MLLSHRITNTATLPGATKTMAVGIGSISRNRVQKNARTQSGARGKNYFFCAGQVLIPRIA